MILFPNCKINIGLDIVSKRADGYHNIITAMYPVNWCDILEIVPGETDEDRLFTSGMHVDCPPEKNLVMKAVRLLRESVPTVPSVDIYLHKVIPDGAGLGGGSSDASFTLKGINSLYTLGLSDDYLAKIASKIGADCPFFIYDKPILATGIGTDFSNIHLELSGYKIVIIKPRVSVPTAMAYSGVVPSTPQRSLEVDLKLAPDQWQGVVKNDFEPSVFEKFPIIAEVKAKLHDMGAVYASMSGSGSAVFGLFEGDILADDIRENFPDCDIFTDC